MTVSLEQPMRPYLIALGESLDDTDENLASLTQDVQELEELAVMEPYVTPEMYGAVGDGVTNDTTAIMSAIDSGKLVMFRPSATYLVGQVLISDKSNVFIEGNNATLLMPYSGSNNRTILGIVNSSDVTVRNLRVTTDFSTNDASTDIASLFVSAPYGISVNNCTRVRVLQCDVSLVKDGIACNDSTEITFSQNRVYNTGQEPMAARQSYGVTITENDLYWHLGDGILVKAYDEDAMSNIVIEGNLLHDPKTGTPTGHSLQVGGGITCNAENTSSVYLTQGMIIANNTIDGCRYGVQISNVSNVVVCDNVANVGLVNGAFYGDSCAFGLCLQAAYNPTTPKTMTHVLFSGNVAVGGKVQYRSYSSSADVPIDAIVFDGNVGMSGNLGTSELCFYVQNSTIINNVVSGGSRIGEFYNCKVRGNSFSDPIDTPSSAQTSDCYFRGDTCIVEGNAFSGHQAYFNCSKLASIVGNTFTFDVTQGIKLNCGSSASVWLEGNTYNGAEVVEGNVYFGGTASNILTDFYRRLSLKVSNVEVGCIHANRDTLHVYLDADFTAGTAIVTVSDAYFKVKSNKQLIGFVAANYSVARVAFETSSGNIVVRASSQSSGHVIVNCQLPKSA